MNGSRDYLKRGSHNVICDRCGFKFKGEELQKEWTGYMVCSTCYEPRHPQDFVRSKPDQQPKAYYRPEPSDNFINTVFVLGQVNPNDTNDVIADAGDTPLGDAGDVVPSDGGSSDPLR